MSRPHEDMDISILSRDAPAFREFLGDRWTGWNIDEDWLRPFSHRFPEVSPDSQVWIRRNAQSPWVLDVPFTPSTDAAGATSATSRTPKTSKTSPGSPPTACATPGPRSR